MSRREKSAWIGIVTILAVYGFYFARVADQLMSGRSGDGGLLGLLSVCVFILICVQFGLGRIVDGVGPREPAALGDERELIAELKATRVAFRTLSIGVGLALCGSVAVALLVREGKLGWDEGGVLIINAVLLAYVVTELIRYASHIGYLRRMS